MTAPDDRTTGLSHEPRRLTVAGVEWQYIATGHGPLGVVLLGDVMARPEASRRLIERFERSYRVIAVDHPRISSVWPIVDALQHIIRAEGFTSVDVVGQGLGAGIAHLFARQSPSSVDRLVLSSFGLLESTKVASRASQLRMQELLPFEEIRRQALRPYELIAEQCDGTHARDVLELALELAAGQTRETLLEQLRIQHSLHAAEPLMRVRSPVRAMLVMPTRDPTYTSFEQDALVRSYEEPVVLRVRPGEQLLSTPLGSASLDRIADFLNHPNPGGGHRAPRHAAAKSTSEVA